MDNGVEWGEMNIVADEEEINDGGGGDSCAPASSSSTYRLFGRQTTIHQIMGGGKVGDPGMRRDGLRVGFEAWNFCNEVGKEAPLMGSPRAADCFDISTSNLPWQYQNKNKSFYFNMLGAWNFKMSPTDVW